ncbi:MAG: FtsX-like permease family protein [Verrucomicrobiae bacterium]|nr:FtsX-like permease family protein [Verrucomicrobiae bacterium]
MVKALDRKLLRDVVAMKGQALAIGAVMACGIAVFVMATATLRTLTNSRDAYYAENRFAEIFVSLVRAPVDLAERIGEIEGVVAVDDRVVQVLTLDLPTLNEPASGRVISLPDRGLLGDGLNVPYLITGRWPEADRVGEVVVSEAFAEANALELGAKLEATLRGRRQYLTVVGVVLSPEYVMQVPPGSIFPDDQRYGIFWMSRRQLAAASDMVSAFNDLNLLLAREAVPEEVIRKLDHILEPYGGSGAYQRNDQQSARFIADELKSLRAISLGAPVIFLSVAAFLLNISLRRILSMQREQIAALKAFGYTNAEVGIHYVKLVAVIVVIAAAVGCLSGTWMGSGMVAMYGTFYRFPVIDYSPGLEIYLIATTMGLMAGVLGVVGGVRATMKLPPAEAMRAEPPASYQPSLLERLGIGRLLSQPGRMVVRELGRRPVKAALTALGIAMACAILLVGDFGKDSVQLLVDVQFGIAERDDARVHFVEAKPARAFAELENIDGVIRAEPFRHVAARLRNGQRFRQLGITGIAEGGVLYRLLDREQQQIPVTGSGLMLSAIVAEKLGLSVGDTVQVEVLEGERPIRNAMVSGLVEDFAGTAAYMNLDALNDMLREGRTVSGAYLQLDSAREQDVFADLKSRPGVAGVTLKKVMIDSFMEQMTDNMLKMRGFILFFASVISIGVVYSSARISFSERGRDLATLRVIGLTRAEVSGILLGELAVLTLVAIPVGLLFGYALCLAMARAMSTEMYRIPFVIHPGTYGLASLIILAASIASGLIVRRKIDSLDLVTALKIKE